LRYPDNCLDAREVKKLTDVGEQGMCEKRLKKHSVIWIEQESLTVMAEELRFATAL
jgi:hypothetical protein